MMILLRLLRCVVAVLAAGASAFALADRAFLLNGLDEKVGFDHGKLVFQPPGKDLVTIVDIGSDPAKPKIVASLPLQNSLFGPPVNLQVTPDQTLALVASASLVAFAQAPVQSGWLSTNCSDAKKSSSSQ